MNHLQNTDAHVKFWVTLG